VTAKSFLKRYLLNRTIRNEYLCVANEKYVGSIKVLAEIDNKTYDFTENHILLGNSPLTILLSKNSELQKSKTKLPSDLNLYFRTNSGKMIAKFKLQRIENCPLNCDSYSLFRILKCDQKLSSSLINIFQHLHYLLIAINESNKFLKRNLYTQTIIAYSIPRILSLIVVNETDRLNIFPCKLHGIAALGEYFISLNNGSKSSKQFKKMVKIVLCYMDSSRCYEVLKLKKNIDREMNDFKNFALEEERSEIFNLPLPLKTIKYFELERIESFEYGGSEVHLMRIINSKILDQDKYTLAHIHRDILEWRLRRQIPTEFIVQ
jgi:flavin reductase (DIM6/NTAB) family NADH-FMN oxidoreductase RutF